MCIMKRGVSKKMEWMDNEYPISPSFWDHLMPSSTLFNVSTRSSQKLWLYSSDCGECTYERVGDCESARLTGSGKILKVPHSLTSYHRFRFRTDGHEKVARRQSDIYNYCDLNTFTLPLSGVTQLRSENDSNHHSPTCVVRHDVSSSLVLIAFLLLMAYKLKIYIFVPAINFLLRQIKRRPSSSSSSSWSLVPFSTHLVPYRTNNNNNNNKRGDQNLGEKSSIFPQKDMATLTDDGLLNFEDDHHQYAKKLELELGQLTTKLRHKESEFEKRKQQAGEDKESFLSQIKTLHTLLNRKDEEWAKKISKLEEKHLIQEELLKGQFNYKYKKAEQNFKDELEKRMQDHRESELSKFEEKIKNFQLAEAKELAHKIGDILTPSNIHFDSSLLLHTGSPQTQFQLLELREAFTKFASSLVPTRGLIESAHLAANSIHKILKQHSNLSIDRILAAGSNSKNMTIADDEHPDYIIVIFLNDRYPPFTQDVKAVLTAFKNFNQTLTGQVDKSRKKIKVHLGNDLGVRFEYKKILFDLLPATNFRQTCHTSDPQTDSDSGGSGGGGCGSGRGGGSSSGASAISSISGSGERERRGSTVVMVSEFRSTLDTMKKFLVIQNGASASYSSNVRLFSSSLMEFSVEFVKGQSFFTHDLIRIANFWNDHIKMGATEAEEKFLFVSGRSYVVELVAIYAAHCVSGVGGSGGSKKKFKNLESTQDLYEGVKYFLQLMKNFKNLNITFNRFYPRSVVPRSILRKRPLILDPVCPYNNLASFKTKARTNGKIIMQFQQKAELTLGKLEDAMKIGRFHDVEEISNIFK